MSKDDKKTIVIPSEVKGLLVIVASVIILLSLVSFHNGNDATNWLGLLGYVLAWVLQYAFGFSSYLIVLFLGWIGWRLLCGNPLKNFWLQVVYFFVLVVSTSLLLTLLTAVEPRTGEFFIPWIYSKKVATGTTISFLQERHYLGGVPAYYLYQDLPRYNLHRLLSNIGVTIIFATLAVVSFMLLAEIHFVTYLKNIAAKMERRSKTPEPTIHAKRNWFRLFKSYFMRFINYVKPKKKALPIEELPLPPSKKSSPTEVKINKEAPLSNKRTTPMPISKKNANTKLDIEEVVPERPPHIWDTNLLSYDLPAPGLLSEGEKINQSVVKKDLKDQAQILEDTLSSFGIEATVGAIHCGPTITSFEIHPASGVKVQKIKALDNDIALNMKAQSIRIIAPIPGKAAVGIEVPNIHPQEVNFKDMLTGYQKQSKKLRIPLLLGKTVNGSDVICDLVKMPHCIIAGATGSGKSVCINTIVMSIIMNMKPDEIKLIMVDPKKVELTPYSRLPHMLSPVITDPEDARTALNWLVKEMEQRYEILKQLGMRHIEVFNNRKVNPELEGALDLDIPRKMPYIVGIIDELADLMMIANTDIETPIARIAQMARAVGIHLIIATQRPSREVITGLIRANFPTRIAFKVASRINSQIILDDIGAETLLGNGDMLFLGPGMSSMLRAQGAFIRDADINKISDRICSQASPQYLIDSFSNITSENSAVEDNAAPQNDILYTSAKELVIETGNASTTFLQRKLKIGYARAASLMDMLENRGIVGPQEGSKPRKVLALDKKKDFEP